MPGAILGSQHLRRLEYTKQQTMPLSLADFQQRVVDHYMDYYHRPYRPCGTADERDWEQDFAYYYILADLDPNLADGWSTPSKPAPQPFTDAHGHLTSEDGHIFNAENEFDGPFWASSASTSVARVRVAQRDPDANSDTTIDVKEFDDGDGDEGDDDDKIDPGDDDDEVDPGDDERRFDPAFPCWESDHFNTKRDFGRQVASMAAGRDGWFYRELTPLASKPCYMAAHAGAPWTEARHAATRKPNRDDPDDQAYLRAARKHNRTRKKGEPRVREDLVPVHYTPAPCNYNAGEALYDDDDDARDLRRALSSLRSIYHSQWFDCLLASGGSYDAREFALLLVATRWRLFMEEKDPVSFPMLAERILDSARTSAATTIRRIREMVGRLRAKNQTSSSLRPNDPRRGPQSAAEKDAAKPKKIQQKRRRRRGGRGRKTSRRRGRR